MPFVKHSGAILLYFRGIVDVRRPLISFRKAPRFFQGTIDHPFQLAIDTAEFVGSPLFQCGISIGVYAENE